LAEGEEEEEMSGRRSSWPLEGPAQFFLALQTQAGPPQGRSTSRDAARRFLCSGSPAQAQFLWGERRRRGGSGCEQQLRTITVNSTKIIIWAGKISYILIIWRCMTGDFSDSLVAMDDWRFLH
jgi:hypothetical protein